MFTTALGFKGGISAPEKAASLAGQEILNEGGTAVEAIVAAASTIAVTYPHMNGIGGDAFWLIKKKDAYPFCISGCGTSAKLASVDWYRDHGNFNSIPERGGLAALTVPGAIKSWIRALSHDNGNIPLKDLLYRSISYAGEGFAVTKSQEACTTDKLDDLKGVPGFSNQFLVDGIPPKAGEKLKQPALKNTLEHLVHNGLESFYSGDIGDIHGLFLEKHNSPLRFNDFTSFNSEMVDPLKYCVSKGQLFNLPAPTQGVTSLTILALFDRLKLQLENDFEETNYEFVHCLVEFTKQALIKRNQGLADPEYMPTSAQSWLNEENLNTLYNNYDLKEAYEWPYIPKKGDTVWMGAIDRYGTVVSFIQSIFWEFGSGLICPETGVLFQNRGAAFSLKGGPNKLIPEKKPFHTLNPALAILNDGRVMAYGTMGGDGQPQTQSAIFSRYAYYGFELQEAITRPRWLLGKTWGHGGTNLKLEDRFDDSVISNLKSAGHSVQLIKPFSDLVGHAGAIVINPCGLIEGAYDPRSDGSALVF